MQTGHRKSTWAWLYVEPMCGIVGLFSKSSAVSERLGAHLGDMLAQMNDRGPDSAGVAVYRNPAPQGSSKLSLYAAQRPCDWEAVRATLARTFGGEPSFEVRHTNAVFVVPAAAPDAEAVVAEHHPEVSVIASGEVIEVYKEVGRPLDFVEAFRLGDIQGTHALGHTRMATESLVTTQHSHPFSTGLDLCLVHNGSLSNHNGLRRELRRQGIEFRTDNDTEVGAGYLTWRLREGASLQEALEGCLEDLDGFYTFLVGTHDGFAVLRDPIAAKPAVIAETDDWVAMASEFRAIAVLPGADDAAIWEPEPATIYAWEREKV